MMKPTRVVKEAFFLPFRAVGWLAKATFNGRVLNQKSGSAFQSRAQTRRWLAPRHTGLLLDGVNHRLSETESFQNVCVIARIGAGKTSRYIIPNVLDRANARCSIVVNDPKGDVFAATSAAMQKAGYHVIVIDPKTPSLSHRFNPLAEARDDVQLEQLAEIIISSGNPNPKEPIWNNGAKRVLSVLFKALRNASQTTDPGTCNLANAFHLLQNFGQQGSGLTVFMSRACINHQNPADTRLWNEWRGVLVGNPDAVQSFALTALTALRAFTNPNMAWLTAESDFDLAALRQRKTIIYFITPPQDVDYYGFLISLFFQSVFNAAMSQMPKRGDLPIYVLYDEFGHATLPTFAAVATTIRAYKVSLTIVLQTVAQLAHRYGPNAAATVQGGFSTILTYSGSDPATCDFFAALCGKVREFQKKKLLDHTDQYREYNLINADQVRCITSDEVLIVSGNGLPTRLSCRPYFESAFRRMAKRGAVNRPPRPVDIASVPLARV